MSVDMDKVVLKQCAFPGCTGELPGHYFDDLCGKKHVSPSKPLDKMGEK